MLDAELRQRNLSYDARQKELTRPSLLGVSEKTKASILEATRDVEKANELIENYRNMWPLYSRNDDELAVFSEDYEKQLVADQSSHRLWTVAFSYNSYVECMIRLQQWWAKARMEKRLAGVSAATFEKELIDRAESLRKERLEKENGTGAPGSSIQADGVEHGNEPQALLSNSGMCFL